MTTASVIFVDDDPDIRPLMEQTLELEDIPVACFADGASALQEVHPDFEGIVLCDYNMPGMDGLACLKQLQLKAFSEPALRVVIVTALNDADKKSEALANGAEAYVLKPDLFEQLPQLLQTRSMF